GKTLATSGRVATANRSQGVQTAPASTRLSGISAFSCIRGWLTRQKSSGRYRRRRFGREGRMIVVLTGGTGGAKFVDGLRRIVPPRDLTFVVNTGDDFQWWGLHISPDVDSITYVLSDLLSKDRGWGVDGDTFQCLEAMRRLGQPAWFQIGDRDL